jgi:hypothetical protein
MMIGLAIANMLWALLLFFLFLIAPGLGGITLPPLFVLCVFLLCIFYVISGIDIWKRNARGRKKILKRSTFLTALALLSMVPYIHKEVSHVTPLSHHDVLVIAVILLIPPIVNFCILTLPKVKEQFK